jgi:LuxR family maltose regulon positive regulatory protein
MPKKVTAVIRHPDHMPVIATKLQCPQYQAQMVERTALLQRLPGPDCKVLLVLAPAGCGKTVLLSQLVRASARPAAWYSLDPHDDEPRTFIRHLAAALQRHTTLNEVQLHRLVSRTEPEALCRPALSFFVDALEASSSGLLIVLDNWQVISDPIIYRFVSELIPLLPAGSQLVLSGRSSLDLLGRLALEGLHLAGQVQLIGRRDLSLTPAELERFFALRDSSLTEEQLELVAALSGGWPITVSFFAQLSSGPETAKERIPPALAAYMDRELLQEMPEEISDFLIKTSVFSQFTAADCDQLLGSTGSEEKIRYLQAHQFFLEQLGEQYNLVPVVRSHLRGKLGPEKPGLYKKAGTIAIGRGNLPQAIGCYLEAGESEGIPDLVAALGEEAVLHGRWQELSSWLEEALTLEQIRGDPRLSLLQALVEINRGQLGHAQKAVDRAESLFTLAGDQIGLAECQLLKARISRGRGAQEESFQFLFDAETNLSTSRFKLLLAIEKSTIYYAAGRFRESREILRRCLEEYEGAGDAEALVRILEALGNVTYLLGEPARALLLFKRALSLCPEGVMPGYDFQDMMSAIYDDWGETEQALLIAERSEALREKMGLTELLPSSCLQLAMVYTNLGRFADAELCFRRGIDYVREHESNRCDLALNLVFLARTLAIQGKWVAARACALEALEVAASLPRLYRTSVPTVAAPILARTGSWDWGLTLLKEAAASAQEMGFSKCLAYAYQSLAYLHFLHGDVEKAREYTYQALTTSAKINDLQNVVSCYHWYHPLLMHGLAEGIETSFVQRVLRKVGERCLKHLLPFVPGGSPEAKQRIIPVLVEIGGDEACSLLAMLQKDAVEYVRNMAAEALERLRSPEESAHRAAVPALRLQLLGPVRIFVDSQELTGIKWRSQRARDLLIYLAHVGQPVTKDQIIEALWPDDNQDLEKADAQFHTTLYRLRTVLKNYGLPDLIQRGTDAYSLTVPASTDLDRFEALLKAALSQEADSPEQMKLLEEALKHYHGDYLENLDYQWVIPHREALRLRCGEAQLRLVHCYLKASQYEKAISELVMLLKRDELNELYHALLIEAYAKSGQRQAAQRQYALLTGILQRELGVKPSPETQQAYHSLNLGPPSD